MCYFSPATSLSGYSVPDFCLLPCILLLLLLRRWMRWAGHVACMGKERGVYRVLVGKPEGKRPLGRPRRRWVDNIRMDLQEVVCGYVDWIGLAQDRDRWRTLVSAVMNLRVPWNAGNFLTSCKPDAPQGLCTMEWVIAPFPCFFFVCGSVLWQKCTLTQISGRNFAVQSLIIPWIATFCTRELKDLTSSVGGIFDTQLVISVNRVF